MSTQDAAWTGRALAESALGDALGTLGDNPDEGAGFILQAIDSITGSPKQEVIRDWAHGWLGDGKPGREFLRKIVENVHPSVRQLYIARMIVSMLFRTPDIGTRCTEEYGVTPPYVMLISPSMRCNYRCTGCYAASYDVSDDMDPDLFDHALGEAEDMGINFFIVLGGEPFIYPHLLPVMRDHDRSFFQVYTNGSFIDRAMAKEIVRMGNIAPQISVNGPAEYTDASRGKGAFDQVMETMDNLRAEGAVFGFSSLVIRDNVDVICSDKWLDLLMEKGALYGWLFLYMPVGDNPDISLMPTP